MATVGFRLLYLIGEVLGSAPRENWGSASLLIKSESLVLIFSLPFRGCESLRGP